MKVRFTCDCGARLECVIRSIGKEKSCPACNSRVTVPKPSERVVKQAIGDVEHAIPGQSEKAYAELVERIIEAAERAMSIAGQAGRPDAAAEFIDNSIRVLRNVQVFWPEDGRQNSRQAFRLLSVAAGTDFGGIGVRKSKLASFRRWQQKQRTEVAMRPNQVVADSIDYLKTFA